MLVSASSREPKCDIAAQISSMLSPDTAKDSVFLAASNDDALHHLPERVLIADRCEGKLLTLNQKKADLFKSKENLSDDDLASILGFPVSKTEIVKSGESNPFVIQGLDEAGNVVSEAATTLAGYSKTRNAIASHIPGNGTIRAVSLCEALARREAYAG